MESGNSGGGIIIAAIMGLIWFVVMVVMIASLWKIYVKAGKPGWACLIPFYNMWVFAEICGKEGWWGLLCLIPFLGLIFAIILLLEFLKKFGMPAWHIILVLLFAIIYYPYLAFSDAQYQG